MNKEARKKNLMKVTFIYSQCIFFFYGLEEQDGPKSPFSSLTSNKKKMCIIKIKHLFD